MRADVATSIRAQLSRLEPQKQREVAGDLVENLTDAHFFAGNSRALRRRFAGESVPLDQLIVQSRQRQRARQTHKR